MSAQALREYGAIVVSVLVTIAFLVALGVAYLSKDQSNLGLLIGAVIAQFSGVVSYWVGSSVGSAKKDDVLSNMAQGPPPP